ncbi:MULTISPECIES: TetR/AcrR family transcriptional regulator [Streptomyces]|uniref:TetR/AcrR family transcriptional regulator n=1 Tax=Streptomyces TaxID=1883 RepID=UPI00163D064F|nr:MULTISPECIES: TetR/AcrR family transcriptional regulator [Streptomyces]MBC2875871.1 TetR/AcrR family transcriptional regulator [Streptomyces sp. TYQ1024]UBI37718.1 TetR/AcrR family transcriptional regulator [Streptomyces mobaraensis]UKW30304.1 TetR/AcrR family transcriptional regulator [Streptomyces sp. TYQ1024]
MPTDQHDHTPPTAPDRPAAPDLPIPSVWTRPHRVRREQPALSREQIVSAALGLLDTDGLEALSMRKLGARLNAGATSLYTHVSTKDELIELAVDEVYGEIDVPAADDPAGWREAAARAAHGLRTTILRHPWLAPALGGLGLTQLGPNAMRLSEGLLALFEAAGLPAGEADLAVSTLSAYVIGMSISEAAWLTTVARSGRTEREWVESLWPAAEEATGEHPQLQVQYASLRHRDPHETRDEKFTYGLRRVLDGLATRITDGTGADAAASPR